MTEIATIDRPVDAEALIADMGRRARAASAILAQTPTATKAAALGVKNLVAYATSKAAINGMTKQLAVELAPYGIRVNTFAPGPINVERNLKDDPDYRSAWVKA